MLLERKRILVLMAFLLILTIGTFAFKSLNHNRIPKSAKLVMNLKSSFDHD